MIEVIIPFFQKEAGILKKCLESIHTQSEFESIEKILIVDDQSPVDAKAEICQLPKSLKDKITVIKQANSGPGGARNKGLDNVAGESVYIAFIDSDDCWDKDHIKNAVYGLERGYDFYFTDFYHIGQSTPAFLRSNKLNLAEHKLLDAPKHIYSYSGDFRKQIICGNLVGTSTVVFRKNPLRNVRFNPLYKNAGEDYLFWLECADLTKRIIFSTEPLTKCGKGVNVYAGAEWGTRHLQHRIYYEIMYKKEILEKYASLGVTAHLQAQIKELKKQYLLNLLALLKRLNIKCLVTSFYHLSKIYC